MPRVELLARIRLWIGRMSDAQLETLAADIEENVPKVCDPRYDAAVARVRGMLGGEEDAEGLVRVLRGRGLLKGLLRPIRE